MPDMSARATRNAASGIVTVDEPTAEAGYYFAGLDAYRAMGMLMVFLAHAYFASFANMRNTFFGPVLDRFDIGLPVFFVLSAFLLYRPYAMAHLGNRPQPSYRRFLANRAFRIIPAYWVALTVLILFFGVGGNLWETLSFYFLLQIYDAARVFDHGFQPIYQSWSLATEASFYVLLPLLAIGLRRLTEGLDVRRGLRIVLASMGLIYAGGVAFRAFIIWADPSWQKQAVLWLPAWLDMFSIGMALAAVSAHIALGGRCPRPIRYLGQHAAVSWGIAGALFLVVVLFRPAEQPLVLSGREYMTRQFLYGLIAAFWLLPSMFGDQRRGRIRSFLRQRVMVFFGAISLSFYLYHVALLEEVQDWTGSAAFQSNWYVLVAIGLPLAGAVAIASHYAVERPFLRLKTRMRKRRAAAA